jgi:hypothetical protein
MNCSVLSHHHREAVLPDSAWDFLPALILFWIEKMNQFLKASALSSQRSFLEQR